MESLLKPYACANASDATHLSLIGGKYNIHPPDRFHRVYSKMHVHGAHLVEKVRYPSRLYIDYDKVSRTFIQEDLISRLRTFSKPCVVCVCQDTWDGVHVIFQDVFVHNKQDACNKVSEFAANSKTLADYDASVYSSGLRMVGSKKNHQVSRVYMPYVAIDGSGNEHIFAKNVLSPELLQMCSIHTHEVLERKIPKLVTETTQHTLPNNMKKLDNGLYYWFTKEKYCENIGREHKSAHRMYELDPITKRMRVRCSCKCTHTGCSGYRGPWQSVPINLCAYIENEDVRPRTYSNKRICSAFVNFDIRDPVHFIENLFG
jgi:hypothetical protein